jgi:hypothetical protein
MEVEMSKALDSIVRIMWHLSRALRRLQDERKQCSAVQPPELMKRFELLLQCGF